MLQNATAAVLLATMLTVFSGPAKAQDDAFPDAAELTAALAAFDVPGAAMAIIQGCAVTDVIVAGTADLSTDLPVAPNTAFEAASLTKPLFAYLVMTLVDDGVIDLDRPLAPRFAYDRITDHAAYATLTPRMILTHRTGLPNWVDEDTAFHDRVAPIGFDAPPGTAFSYSGEGIQLLQAYVEEITGQSLQSLFTQRLGQLMPHSTLVRPIPETVTPARGYGADPAPGEGRGLDNLYDQAMAASSLVTTAGDYAAFLAHVCAGEGLSEASHAEMLRPQSPAPDSSARPPASWGLGWMILDLGPVSMAGHGGNNEEFTAFGGFMPGLGAGLVVLTNGRNGEAMISTMLMSGGS